MLDDAVHRLPSLTVTHKQILCMAAILMATYCEDSIAAAGQAEAALERCSGKAAPG